MKVYNIKLNILVLLLSIAAVSCKQNELPQYEENPAVYFSYLSHGKPTGYQVDSIRHSFFLLNSEIVKSTVMIRMNTMGSPTDIDRPISIVQANEGEENAAIPGVHYVSFSDPEVMSRIMIRAGRVYDSIPIVWIRHSDMDISTIKLELKIAENQYFHPGVDRYTRFTVTTTAMAIKPSNWSSWESTFGPTWGSVKMKFIIDYVGDIDWGNPSSDTNYLTYLRTKALQKLKEYNEAHPNEPLKEVNGDFVTF